MDQSRARGLSGAAWLVVLTAQITGDPVAAALPDAATLLCRLQFGNIAGLRLAIALLLAAVLQWHQLLGGLRWLALGLALCFAGSLAWTGHSGAGDGVAGDAAAGWMRSTSSQLQPGLAGSLL